MAAAVADFRPRAPAAGKLSRRTTGSEVSLALEAVPDLLAGLARARRGARPYLVGFAAETAAGDALVERAGAKLREKRCDAIVANDVSAAGIGFGSNDNEVTLLFGDGERHALARAPKRAIADRLWDLLGRAVYRRGRRPMPDPRLKTYAPQAVRHLAAAGHVLADRQETAAGRQGQRPRLARLRRRRFPRHAVGHLDLGASPAAVGCDPLPGAARAAWAFVETNAKRFIPDAIDNAVGDETAYDCALALLASAAERGLRAPTGSGRRSPIGRRACSPIIWARWKTCPGASSAIPGSWRSRSPNTRAPSTIAVCWRARASSSTARSG